MFGGSRGVTGGDGQSDMVFRMSVSTLVSNPVRGGSLQTLYEGSGRRLANLYAEIVNNARPEMLHDDAIVLWAGASCFRAVSLTVN